LTSENPKRLPSRVALFGVLEAVSERCNLLPQERRRARVHRGRRKLAIPPVSSTSVIA
jgi:hypothetical protein